MSILPELTVALLAMLPVTELRVAIPVGILIYGMPPWEAFLIAEIGNALPIVIVYALGDWSVTRAQRKRGRLHHWLHLLMHRSHRRVHDAVQKWGPLALALYVALPLPATGVWIAAIGAYALHIKFARALPAIVLGNIIAGIIMVLATTGAVAAFKIFVTI